MPVGTQGTVKGLTPDQVRAAGTQILLGNTYHLALRPGDELIAETGRPAPLHGLGRADPDRLRRLPGLQPGPDPQGHRRRRLVSLAHRRGTARPDPGAGRSAIQENLGSDIAMVLDECPPADAPEPVLREAIRRTLLWAERCRDGPHARRPGTVRHRPGRDQPRLAAGMCASHSIGDGLPRLRPRRVQRRRVRGRDARGPARLGRPACRPTSRATSWASAGRKTCSPESRPGSTCSTASCRPGTAAMPRPSPPTGRSGCATPATGEIPPRSSPVAPATRARTSAGRICTTCSRRTRCWARRCCRCTTSPIYLRLMADARRAIEERRFAAFRSALPCPVAAGDLG